jgi:hypothetical protein
MAAEIYSLDFDLYELCCIDESQLVESEDIASNMPQYVYNWDNDFMQLKMTIAESLLSESIDDEVEMIVVDGKFKDTQIADEVVAVMNGIGGGCVAMIDTSKTTTIDILNTFMSVSPGTDKYIDGIAYSTQLDQSGNFTFIAIRDRAGEGLDVLNENSEESVEETEDDASEEEDSSSSESQESEITDYNSIPLDSEKNIDKYLTLKYGTEIYFDPEIASEVFYAVAENRYLSSPEDYTITVGLEKDISDTLHFYMTGGDDLINPPEFYTELKNEAIVIEQQYEDFMYTIAQDLMDKLPDKKLLGKYHAGKRVGYYNSSGIYRVSGSETERYEWQNYDGSGTYDETPAINQFQWTGHDWFGKSMRVTS